MARPKRIVPGPGRPSGYSQAKAEVILRGIAGGRSSTEMCRKLNLPSSTVADWRGAHPEFRTAYVEAFRSRAYGMVEEAMEIVDGIPPDADMARVQRERTRAELRRWTASRLVVAFAETNVTQHQLGNAVVNIFLPRKGSSGTGAPALDGQVTRLIEDGTGDGGTEILCPSGVRRPVGIRVGSSAATVVARSLSSQNMALHLPMKAEEHQIPRMPAAYTARGVQRGVELTNDFHG